MFFSKNSFDSPPGDDGWMNEASPVRMCLNPVEGDDVVKGSDRISAELRQRKMKTSDDFVDEELLRGSGAFVLIPLTVVSKSSLKSVKERLIPKRLVSKVV